MTSDDEIHKNRKRHPSHQQSCLSDEGNNSDTDETDTRLLYGINDVPPWYFCFFLALQNIFFTVGSLIGLPLLIAPALCLENNEVGNLARANLINTTFLICGLCTLLQVVLGNRLPIFQGASFGYLPAALAILSLPHNQCPKALPDGFMNSTTPQYNDTDGTIVDGDELWMRRMREIQGSITLAAVVEVFFGLAGFIGFLKKFIGPLTIAPMVTLVGLDLFSTFAAKSEGHWGIAIGTSGVLILCSQYCVDIGLPVPWYSRKKKLHWKKFYVFKHFSILVSLLISWLICHILTVTNTLPDDPNHPNYQARTDIRAEVISSSPWFRISYPGQWGLPKVTVAGFLAMLSNIVPTMFASLGDYYACASITKVPSPPEHAINRGISIEGFGNILAGLFGTGTGNTSFSENIAIIGVTRVASRRVMLVTGMLLVILSVFAKIGSVFVTLPDPVLGGLLMVIFGMIASVGLRNLQYVDLNSRRNMFIIGFSLLSALTTANWIKSNPGAIQTGISVLDQIFTVLLSSALIIGGVLGFVFDNTLPGTKKERGIKTWNLEIKNQNGSEVSYENYNLPFPTSGFRFSRFIPIFPEFQKSFRESKTNEKYKDMKISKL